jgi:hypothetical protein
VHICVLDDFLTKLIYATNSGGSWSTQTIATGAIGSCFSMAVDSKSHVHVVYHILNSTGLSIIKYVTNAGGSWSTETIDSSAGGYFMSIAVDSQDYLHIIYYNGDNRDLRQAINDSVGAWEAYNSIAVDSQGYMHISYGKKDIGYNNYYDLKYATNTGGSWSIQTIETLTNAYYNSIAVDSQGHVHISYENWVGTTYSQSDLEYATDEGGSWSNHTINDAISGGYSSIALDSQDNVHIGYYSAANMYATNMYATNFGGSWSYRIIDYIQGVWGFNSIFIDPRDQLHMSYVSNSKLMYTTFPAIPSPPGAPTELAATPGSGQVVLKWTGPTSDGGSSITSYKVFYGTSTHPNSTFVSAGPESTSTTISGLETGTVYYFNVVAVNAAGNSTASSDLVILLPVSGQSVPWITSTSNVSGFSFNVSKNELTFTVSGALGTTGEARIFIPSDLVGNSAKITVKIDEQAKNYELSSVTGGWALDIVYNHSTHSVVVSLGALPNGNWADSIPLVIFIVVAIVIISVVSLLVFRKKKG